VGIHDRNKKAGTPTNKGIPAPNQADYRGNFGLDAGYLDAGVPDSANGRVAHVRPDMAGIELADIHILDHVDNRWHRGLLEETLLDQLRRVGAINAGCADADTATGTRRDLAGLKSEPIATQVLPNLGHPAIVGQAAGHVLNDQSGSSVRVRSSM
jgi:hypothetical protein